MRIILLLVTFIMAGGSSSAADRPIDASICEIVSNPVMFSGKLVRVRGEVVTHFEVADIRAECDFGMAMIALWYPDMVRDSNATDFKLAKNKTFREFETALSKHYGGMCIEPCAATREGHVIATLTGRLDGPDKLIAKDKDGRTVVRSTFGYTPSMKYDTRLVLRSVTDVTETK